MKFTLQDMIRQTLSEADRREKLAADEKVEGKKEEHKDKVDSQTAPERNENTMMSASGEKTGSVFVTKLANAVEYIASELLKEANETGAGKGPNHMETTLNNPPGGHQHQNYETGEAHTGKVPTKPGHDVKSPGQVLPGTAMATDMNDRPGGQEDWSVGKDKMKQARVLDVMDKMAFSVSRAGHRLDAREYATMSKAHHDLEGHNKAYGEENPLGSHVTGRAVHPVLHRLAARHLDYAAKKHEKGRNAYNPFGGLLTPSRHEKTKKSSVERIFDVMHKMAYDGKDAYDEANITAGHHDVPPAATASEEGVPGLPAEANRQEALIMSLERAKNYTKRDAKEVPKARMGEVLSEPAQKKSTDPVLHNNLDATSSAGVKLSAAKTAAARALLMKIAEEGEKETASEETKERAEKLKKLVEAKKEVKEEKQEAKEAALIGGGY